MINPAAKPQVLLFDVNETLLDIRPVKAKVAAILQDEKQADLWFATMLQYSLVATVSGQYFPFPELGAAVLRMQARNAEATLSPEDAKSTLSVMTTLPPHPDVEPGLRRLRDAGFRLATLTNSSAQGVEAQMTNSGLGPFFERRLSVDSVRKFKPHADVYAWAAREMGVDPADCMLVAAHGWDCAGAKWAGMKAAFIARERQQKFPLAPEPDLDVSDLGALADALAQ